MTDTSLNVPCVGNASRTLSREDSRCIRSFLRPKAGGLCAAAQEVEWILVFGPCFWDFFIQRCDSEGVLFPPDSEHKQKNEELIAGLVVPDGRRPAGS